MRSLVLCMLMFLVARPALAAPRFEAVNRTVTCHRHLTVKDAAGKDIDHVVEAVCGSAKSCRTLEFGARLVVDPPDTTTLHVTFTPSDGAHALVIELAKLLQADSCPTEMGRYTEVLSEDRTMTLTVNPKKQFLFGVLEHKYPGMRFMTITTEAGDILWDGPLWADNKHTGQR